MKPSPMTNQERIVMIDVIRGFALIGIFLVNMSSFHTPLILNPYPEYSGIDHWLDVFLQMFVQTKFYTIFSFLFGLGFYLFMSRAEEKGLAMNQLFTRRLLVLLLFGAIHFIFIWYGDILHTYALTGFLLLLFYRRKVKTLLIWAFTLLFMFYSLIASQFYIPAQEYEKILQPIEQENKEKLPEYVTMYEEGAYWDWVVYRFDIEIMPQIYQLPIIMMPVLAMFLFGLIAGKLGIFQSNSIHQSKIKKIWLFSLLLGIPLAVITGLLKTNILDYGIYQYNAVFFFTGLSGVALCFFYLSSITLLLRKGRWQRILRHLGPLGQMALTNYLMQTLISVFIFLGLNFYGNVSLTAGTLLCLIVLIGQIIFSSLWLKHFRFGPMEWLWRSLTYGSMQRLRVKKTRAVQIDDSGFFH